MIWTDNLQKYTKHHNHIVMIIIMSLLNKTIGDEGITVDFRFIKVHTSN